MIASHLSYRRAVLRRLQEDMPDCDRLRCPSGHTCMPQDRLCVCLAAMLIKVHQKDAQYGHHAIHECQQSTSWPCRLQGGSVGLAIAKQRCWSGQSCMPQENFALPGIKTIRRPHKISADITLPVSISDLPLGLAGFKGKMRAFQLMPNRDAGQGTAASPGENFNLPSNAESERRLISIRDTIPRELVVSSCICQGESETSPRPIWGKGGVRMK